MYARCSSGHVLTDAFEIQLDAGFIGDLVEKVARAGSFRD